MVLHTFWVFRLQTARRIDFIEVFLRWLDLRIRDVVVSAAGIQQDDVVLANL